MVAYRLDELLPPDGLEAVALFREELKAGNFKGEHYLDIHTNLRARLEPFKQHLADKGMVDIDFFVIVLLTRLGVNEFQ